jgi:tRNA-dihydrouridine synthase B
VLSNPALKNSPKHRTRLSPEGILESSAVQISGHDPVLMAELARQQADAGAKAIDINMGCPVKKMCRKQAGSALLKDPEQVQNILAAVVGAVEIPVTLKTRLGWDSASVNILEIAQIAVACGVSALAIHGRTRAQNYSGTVDYEPIRAVKSMVDIPVWVNGDIRSPKEAQSALVETGAYGVMIGRASCGEPWLWRDVASFLKGGTLPERISIAEASELVRSHLEALYAHYGEQVGLRMARKHLIWYLKPISGGEAFCKKVNLMGSASEQFNAVDLFLRRLPDQIAEWPCSWREGSSADP